MALNLTSNNLQSNYILRHVQNQWCTPEDYGAKGDNLTDDTGSFQIALNSGKSLKCYKKDYKIDGTLKIPSNCIIPRLDIISDLTKFLTRR